MAVQNDQDVNEHKKMIKARSKDDKKDMDWEHFAQHLDKVLNDFVVK